MGKLRKRWQDIRSRHDGEIGASLVEYALLLALIAVVCIGAISFVGKESSSKYEKFGNCWAWAGTNNSMPAECG